MLGWLQSARTGQALHEADCKPAPCPSQTQMLLQHPHHHLSAPSPPALSYVASCLSLYWPGWAQGKSPFRDAARA